MAVFLFVAARQAAQAEFVGLSLVARAIEAAEFVPVAILICRSFGESKDVALVILALVEWLLARLLATY